MRNLHMILSCLSACDAQPDPKPNDAELGAFMNKLDSDEKVGADATLAKSREKERRTAADAETRLEDYSDNQR